MRRARVFPLFRRFTQRGSKTVSSISISRLVRRVCARDAKWAAPNPRLRVKFSFFPPTARPKRIRSSRRSDLSRVEANLQKVAFCQLGKKNRRLGRYFSSGRTARAPVDTTATRERRVPDREARRTQIRVAPQRKHPREGAHFDRVRPHAAHAPRARWLGQGHRRRGERGDGESGSGLEQGEGDSGSGLSADWEVVGACGNKGLPHYPWTNQWHRGAKWVTIEEIEVGYGHRFGV